MEKVKNIREKGPIEADEAEREMGVSLKRLKNNPDFRVYAEILREKYIKAVERLIEEQAEGSEIKIIEGLMKEINIKIKYGEAAERRLMENEYEEGENYEEED